MASEPRCSRPSSFGLRPGPPVPSRTSSLKISRKPNFTTAASPANATSSGETPALSSGPVHSKRQSLTQNPDTLGFLQHDPAISLRGCSSRRPQSSSVSRRPASCSATLRRPMAPQVKRWAGLTRTVSEWGGWDGGLRRDPELWFDHGDCLVYLYAYKASQRPASFRVPYTLLRNCSGLFSLCYAEITPPPSSSVRSRRLSGNFTNPISSSHTVSLYIPAPEDVSREDAFAWHLNTRNFFAWLLDIPLVGTHFSRTLIDLQERMHLFRSGDVNNYDDLLSYCEEMGYRDLVECPDYALGMLNFAEKFKMRDVFIDALAHAVGMNESLALSSEYRCTSRLTKMLINRLFVEQDLHLHRVSQALSTFLADDLSPAVLGLPDGARAHLDKFRSWFSMFLQSKFGYWPPPSTASAFPKSLYFSIYYDVLNLYDYLADTTGEDRPASGGICVIQNVHVIDSRHGFSPLPCALPLLPTFEEALKRKTPSQKALKPLKLGLGSKQAGTDKYLTARSALTAATNRDVAITSTPIVQAYMRFERQLALNHRDEKLNMSESRKVRWLLIYGMLQYLISAIRAPKEVRDTSADYPLCCIIPEQAPWHVDDSSQNTPLETPVNVPQAIENYLMETTYNLTDEFTPASGLVISPDCKREDYFDTPPSRPISVEVPAPLKITPPTPMSTFRRFSFSSRSSRRNSVVLKPSQHCEILVQGYGNGLSDIDPPSQETSSRQSVVYSYSKRSSKSTLPDGAGPDTSWLRPITPESSLHSKMNSRNLEISVEPVLHQARTPIFDSTQFDTIVGPTDQTPPRSADSSSSTETPFWSDGSSPSSSQSSTNGEYLEQKPSAAEESGLLGGLVPIVVEATPTPSPKRSMSSKRSTPTKAGSPKTATGRGEFRFSFNNPTTLLESMQQGTNQPENMDSTIGVALSAPPPAPQYRPPPPPMFMRHQNLSLNSLSEYHRPLPRSISTESLALSRHMISPLRMHPPEQPQPLAPAIAHPKQSVLDIYSALEMNPSQHNGNGGKSRRKFSEADRQIMDAAPPPIPKTSQPTKKSQAKASKAVEEEERGRKKERRRSFWRR